jgi:hypothetical protein
LPTDGRLVQALDQCGDPILRISNSVRTDAHNRPPPRRLGPPLLLGQQRRNLLHGLQKLRVVPSGRRFEAAPPGLGFDRLDRSRQPSRRVEGRRVLAVHMRLEQPVEDDR